MRIQSGTMFLISLIIMLNERISFVQNHICEQLQKRNRRGKAEAQKQIAISDTATATISVNEPIQKQLTQT